MSITAMKLALELLEALSVVGDPDYFDYDGCFQKWDEFPLEPRIAALRTAIAEAERQEQCWCDATGIGEPGVSCGDCPKDYAAPVQAQRQDQDESDSLTIAYMSGYADGKKAAQPAKPLTDEELNHIYEEYHDRYGQPINSNQNGWAYERAIEAKIKEQP